MNMKRRLLLANVGLSTLLLIDSAGCFTDTKVPLASNGETHTVRE